MRPQELSKLLAFAIVNKFPLLITGQPGIGKSDITEQACKDAGADLIISHPVVSDPTDFKGLPFAASGEAHFLPFGDLNRLIKADKPTVYFLDDLGQAPPAVQAACMQLILARRINGFEVSKHVTFVAATNRKEDKAGVSGILEPVKSRFASIIQLDIHTDDWVEWALGKGNMPVELISFIRFRPQTLENFKASRDIVNTPSPRTIAYVGKLQNAGIPDELRYEAFKGAAGEAFAVEYNEFLKVYLSLPNIDQVLMAPDKAEVPVEPGALYAIAGVLASKMTDVNAENAFIYIDRLPAEIGVACVKDATMRTKTILQTKGFIKWATKYGNLMS